MLRETPYDTMTLYCQKRPVWFYKRRNYYSYDFYKNGKYKTVTKFYDTLREILQHLLPV